MALSLAGIESMMKNEFGNPIGLVLVGGVAAFTWPELWVDDADYDKAMQIAGDYSSAASDRLTSGENSSRFDILNEPPPICQSNTPSVLQHAMANLG